MAEPLLDVRGLTARFSSPAGSFRAADGVSFSVEAGETLGLVGESGSGKTVTALSILGLLPQPGRVTSGEALLEGRDLLRMPAEELRRVRGPEIGMIFQEPLSALNPVFTCGDQVAEPLRVHRRLPAAAARREAVALLAQAGIPDPERRARDYPHQLSGGQRQRVLIAMALALAPKLLIADEPTTALDVTIQAQILDLLARLREERRLAMLLITHNLGVVASMARRVAVMYAGRIVEVASATDIFREPRHPYTRALLDSIPRLTGPRGVSVSIPGQVPDLLRLPAGCAFHPRCPLAMERCRLERPEMVDTGAGRLSACFRWQEAGEARPAPAARPAVAGPPRVEAPPVASTEGTAAGTPPDTNGQVLLEARSLVGRFVAGRDWLGRPRRWLKAVDGVDLQLRRGETLGLVGESGCGKTTLAWLLLRLLEPAAGEILYEGLDLARLGRSGLRPWRRKIQMVFQDPAGSLNPRLTVREILTEPLEFHGVARGGEARQRAAELLEMVGLQPDHGGRYPHEFSGGQRQRIGIARALAPGPRLLVLDEPVSALDVSVQAQILGLLAGLKERLDLTYLFVAHDLAVVRHLADRVAVMYLGQIVELSETDMFYSDPLHPYSKALLAAVPSPEPGPRRPAVLPGDPTEAGPGCRFAPRCGLARESCRSQEPPLAEAGPGRRLRCPVVGGALPRRPR